MFEAFGGASNPIVWRWTTFLDFDQLAPENGRRAYSYSGIKQNGNNMESYGWGWKIAKPSAEATRSLNAGSAADELARQENGQDLKEKDEKTGIYDIANRNACASLDLNIQYFKKIQTWLLRFGKILLRLWIW